jgi:hypothetical protein
MKFKKLVPEIYYVDIKIGLKLFVECLEFTIGHAELNAAQPFCVVDKDGLSLMLFENEEYAKNPTRCSDLSRTTSTRCIKGFKQNSRNCCILT